MSRPDDSTLSDLERAAVERRARELLDRSSAWGRFPTPVDDILAAANLRVAPRNAFDIAQFVAYVRKKTMAAAATLKSALSKVLGIYDAGDRLIHVDGDVTESKQTFLKLHETGHHELPSHRKVFTFFEDCEQTLAPEIADLFEREANNFARFALFQGDAFQNMAADMPVEIKTPITLSRKFGASVYSAAREFARTHHRACLLYALEPIEYVPGKPARAEVRRIEPSLSFRQRFGEPKDAFIEGEHPLAKLLPIGRKMTRPTRLVYADRNGDKHECIGEAFATKFNVFLLVYVVKSLEQSSIWVPANLQRG
jgi:hypothetical protein